MILRMTQNSSVSNALFDELFAAVESIGIDGTIKSLQEAKSNSLLLKDLNIDFVLTCVSDTVGISKEKILHSNDRNDERKAAVALSVFFIKNEFYYSFPELKKIFKKDIASLSRANSIVKNRSLKPKTDFDKNLDTYFKKINLLITEKKINNAK